MTDEQLPPIEQKIEAKEGATIHSVSQTIIYRRPSSTIPFQSPPLPRYFVDRPEVIRELKSRLLRTDVAAGVLMVSAIHGLGGVGKSTLVAALAHDAEVQKRFPDAILWATLGQEPDLLSLTGGWIQALGDYDFRPTSVEAASLHLRSLLRDKAALLVVDDVWDSAHVQPFLVGGSQCQMLITSREALIAKAIGAELFDLNVLTAAQAMELLEKHLGCRLAGSEAEQAHCLAKELGYLPLALELSAAQISDGVPWGELLKDLQAEIALLESLDMDAGGYAPDEATRKRMSLMGSFNLSLRRLSEEQRQTFAWLGVLPEDATITPAMAGVLWGLDERAARNTLRRLRDKALLRPGATLPDNTRSYHLHDLLHDSARRLLTAPAAPRRAGDLPGLSLSLKEAHSRLLDRYRSLAERNSWYALPADGYIHSHLTWHMAQAGRFDEIHQLLQGETPEGRNAWYSAQEQLGQTSRFVGDVNRAWDLSANEGVGRLRDGRRVDDIGAQVRHALMIASVNSLASNLPPSLLAVLVEHGQWVPAQGMAYARQMPDAERKTEALIRLSEHLPEPLKQEALLEAAATAQGVPGREWRDPPLSVAASNLNEPLKSEILKRVLDASLSITGGREDILMSIAPHLPDALLGEALAAARGIDYEHSRVESLSVLIPRLPEPLKSEVRREALHLTFGIQDPDFRAKALVALAANMQEPLQAEALRAVWEMQHGTLQSRALASLVPHLPEPFKSTILDDLLEMIRQADVFMQRDVLLSLIPNLDRPRVEKALEIARTVSSSYFRLEILASLASHVPESARRSILQEALADAQKIEDVLPQVRTLLELKSYLPQPLKDEIIGAAVSGLESAFDAWQADGYSMFSTTVLNLLSVISRHSSEPPLQQSLIRFREVIYWQQQDYVLSEFVPHLPEPLRSDLIAEVLDGAPEPAWLVRVIKALAPHWPAPLIPDALAAARELPPGERMEALAHLIPRLGGRAQTLTLDEVLLASSSLEPYRRVKSILLPLATHLSEPLAGRVLQEAISAVRTIGDGYEKTELMADLLACVPEETRGQLVEELLSLTRRVPAAYKRAELISAAAPYLSGNLLDEALRIAKQDENEWARISALSALSPHVPERLRDDMLRDVLDVARKGEPQDGWEEVTKFWAAYLPLPVLEEALTQSLKIAPRYVGKRVASVNNLVPRLKELPPSTLYPLWNSALHDLAASSREDFLDVLRVLFPVAFALGGAEGMEGVFHAMKDTRRWWP